MSEPDRPHSTPHGRVALVLTLAGVGSALLLIPYLHELMPDLMRQIDRESPIPLPLIIVLQTGLYFTFGSWLGLRAGYALGLDAPWLRALVYRKALPQGGCRSLGLSALLGLGLGTLALGFTTLVLPLLPYTSQPLPQGLPRWTCFLASFYGGIGEEIFSRLIVMTLLVWVLAKVFSRAQARAPSWVYAVSAVLAGAIFAAGHLGAAAQLWPLTPLVLVYVMVANMIVGVPLGFVFWKRGLEAAMVAHFSADMVLHVIAAN